MKKIKNYKTECSPLYGLSNKKRLATLLKTNLNKLLQMQSDKYYQNYSIKQKDKTRNIQEPVPSLKYLQKYLKNLLQRLETPHYLISGKKGNSFVTNAKQHINSKYFLKIDIENFYTNSKKEYVFRFFHYTLKMSEDVAWLITDIATYNNLIPTGSPSSQIIAYWAYSNIFNRIKVIADQYHLIFTAYVDDLTFSSKQPITTKLPYLINNELKTASHKIKTKKTKFLYPSQYKKITGCCISPKGELKIPNQLRYKIKKEEENYLKSRSKKKNRLLGLILATRQIESNMYKEKFQFLKNQ